MTNIAEVVEWKHGSQEGMETKEGVITAFPGGIPSKADQDAWTEEYEAHLASTKYSKDRAKDYAPIGDQLDMIYWDMKNNSTTFVDHIDGVKTRHKKPQ